MAAFPVRLATVLGAVLLPAVAAAQVPPIRPGLWEVRSDRQVDGRAAPPVSESLKTLPPEVRAKVEASMKAKGIAVGNAGASRICLTAEALDAGHWQAAANCKTVYGPRSATQWKWRSTCVKPEAVSDGEAVFANAENYTVSSTSKLTFRGETRTTQSTIKARWLGADCGDLKPLVPKPVESKPAESKPIESKRPESKRPEPKR